MAEEMCTLGVFHVVIMEKEMCTLEIFHAVIVSGVQLCIVGCKVSFIVVEQIAHIVVS